MSSFTEDLITKFVPSTKMFKVHLAFAYHIGSEDSDEIVFVPEGFMTDLASIPPVARWLIPKIGKHAQAAVLHDYMYNKKLFKRKKCDYIFKEAMGVLKVPEWKRNIMYSAVRTFGWIPWGKDV